MAKNDSPQARVKKLARKAMEEAAANNNEKSDFDAANADYEERRKMLRAEGIARGKAHNQELHEQAQIRKHGGYQWPLFG